MNPCRPMANDMMAEPPFQAAGCPGGVRQARYSGHQLRSAGFTLVELMIVVAIIAVLAAIALPTYTSYITKTRRTAAKGCLSEYANYMERYYTTNLRYDQDTQTTPVQNSLTLAGLDCATPQRTGNDYGYSFPSGAASVSTYTIQAVPISGSAQAKRDTLCGTLTLNQAGKRTASGTGTLDQCW
ncbi:type IV pilus assembly protein PilE [Rhodanobacter sp. OK091]|nr:type IV pilus assembly protein PilE [Rhodanobacter sp. OK091]